VKPAVLVVGDVITDISVQLREPVAWGTDTRSTVQPRAGGSAANAAAWMAVAEAEVVFVGRVGNDVFADFHRQELGRLGVETRLAVDLLLPTGSIVVLVNAEGERTMLTDRGANLDLRPDDLPARLFRKGDTLYITGYSLFEPGVREAGLHALDLARRSGMTVAIDPSNHLQLQGVGPDRFFAWTKGADYLFPNLTEGKALTGHGDPETMARSLADRYGEVVLTMGAEGALWCRREEAIVRVAAESVPVVDTTGAGDAFAAGFLASRLSGGSPGEALAAGSSLAGRVVSQIGARPGDITGTPRPRAL
jgi:sugar/nucleoside kinase (ribokinase family)